MVTYNLTLKDSDVQFQDDVTRDITLTKTLCPNAIEVNDIVEIHYIEDPSTISHKYTVKNILDDVVELAWIEQLGAKVLNEAPVIKLNPEDMNNPETVDLKNNIQQALDQEAEAEAKQAIEVKQQMLKSKYEAITEAIKATIDYRVEFLEKMFNVLVPSSGTADSVAGEYIRAMMRMLYRDYNDGDKFFMGYGLETCGSSAQYLMDHGFEEQIKAMLEDALELADNDKLYTERLKNLTADVIKYIQNNIELIWTPNEEDSRDYPYDVIEETQPRYEFEIPASDDVVDLIAQNVLNSWDLTNYVEEQLDYMPEVKDAVVGRPWSYRDTTVSLENLTYGGYSYLQHYIEHDLDGFWDDLVTQYADSIDEESEETDEEEQ